MSRKYHVRKQRSRSNYPARLKRRGMTSATVRMEDTEVLRTRQARRAAQDYAPWEDR